MKRVLCILLAFLDLVFVVIVIGWPGLVDDIGCNYEVCLGIQGDSGKNETWTRTVLGVIRFFSIVAWFLSERLLEYQYRKGLSEQWYSHKAFWILNAMINAGSLAYSCYRGYYKWTMITDRVIIFLFNMVLLILMFNTKPRQSVDEKRLGMPAQVMTESECLMDVPVHKEPTISAKLKHRAQSN